MFLAGFVAWTTAIGLAVNNKAASVAVTFTLAGMLLIAGAALYARIRWFGTKGIGVAPIEQAVSSFVDRLPPPDPRVPPERERVRLVEALKDLIAELADDVLPSESPSTRELESPVDKAVETYEAGIKMEAGARELFESQGFTVESGAPYSGIDLYARRDDITRPVTIVTRSNRSDGFDLYRRKRLLSHLGDAPDVSPIVVTDVEPEPSFRDELISGGIGIVQVDPTSGKVQTVFDPETDSEETP